MWPNTQHNALVAPPQSHAFLLQHGPQAQSLISPFSDHVWSRNCRWNSVSGGGAWAPPWPNVLHVLLALPLHSSAPFLHNGHHMHLLPACFPDAGMAAGLPAELTAGTSAASRVSRLVSRLALPRLRLRQDQHLWPSSRSTFIDFVLSFYTSMY